MTNRTGQVVVVLGASGGLGSGLARCYAKDGASLVLADIEAEALRPLAEELGQQGNTVLSVVTDIADPKSIAGLVEQATERFPAVDVVCNTVGVAAIGPTWELTRDDWRWMLDVNVLGVVALNEAWLPVLRKQDSGHIVHTASTLAFTSVAANAGYVASKAAVVSICESMQQDLRADGSAVRVSVIMPGPIRSRIYDAGRNRQADYPARAPTAAEQAKFDQIRGYLEEFGADPEVLGGIIVEQIDAGRFYIFGRHQDAEYAIQRLEDVRTGSLSEPSWAEVPSPGSRALTRDDESVSA